MIEDCGNHEWEEVEYSRFAGTPHRKCKHCKFISLDLEETGFESENEGRGCYQCRQTNGDA